MKGRAYLLAVVAAGAWVGLAGVWMAWPPIELRAAQRVTSQKININAATAGELCLLPGVGPVMAGHIVELRNQRGGRFDAPENLLATPRLGRAAFEKMRGLIECGPTTMPADERR